MTGPNNGPITNSDNAAPRFSCGIRSEILAPPSVIGHTPNVPAKKRNTINCAILPATAHAIVKTRNMTLQAT